MWSTLSTGGPLTVPQLKKKLNGEGELLNFALGWLAREDKIDLIPDKKSFRVQLR
ncbi:MAG: winged helix-turn-helix domain-containing protein [Terriglobia bacterium]